MPKWWSSVPRKIKHSVFQGLNRNEEWRMSSDFDPELCLLPLLDFEALIEDHSVQIILYSEDSSLMHAQYGSQAPAIMGHSGFR